MSETRRIFMAAPLAGRLIAKIHDGYNRQVEQAIADYQIPATWTPEDAGRHITLRFVGDVETGAPLIELYTAMNEVAAQHPPMILTLGGRGVFNISRKPQDAPKQAYWVGVGGHVSQLCGLAAAMDSAIRGAGYPPATFDFKPHFTIGRADCETWDGAATLRKAWETADSPTWHTTPYLLREVGMYASERMASGKVMYVRVGQPMPLNPAMLG